LKNNINTTTPVSEPYSLSPKRFGQAGMISGIYLLVSYVLIGFKSDQLALAAFFSVLYLASPVTRKFILGFSIFIVYWIIFDYMKAFPNYYFNAVAVQSLHDLEARFFGIAVNGAIQTPNEYWIGHSSSFLDVLSGIFYLCWVPVPLAFAAYLFFKDSSRFLEFSLVFLLVNLLGFVIYYLYPAAPPWYVQYYGADFQPATASNPAGLIRFDHFFNATVFQSLYSKGSNVFAAVPSLHSSYPLLVLYYGLKYKLGAVNIFFSIITVGIWFAAVYTTHHYVLDVVAGILTAIAGILLFNGMKKNNRFRSFLERYRALISPRN
jgi:hypothetical protein